MAKVLVLAPHPDDEVLGCGGTIVKHVSVGDEVYLCIVTKAYPPDWSEDEIPRRKQEVLKLLDRLPIPVDGKVSATLEVETDETS